tara:strand:+ start:19199 stop:20008 length:810 start_codon:yes stop_codon:yes gene_type:complete
MKDLLKYHRPVSLTREEILEKAPSVFATEASGHVSEKYTFIPTTQVIEDMEGLGWKVYSAEQRTARTKARNVHTKHLLRFRNESLSDVLDCIPEITLTNSHDGRNAFQFYVGLYRPEVQSSFVIRHETLNGLRIKHQWYTLNEVRDVTQKVINHLPTLIEQVELLNNTNIGRTEQREYAMRAMMTRWGKDYPSILQKVVLNPLRGEEVTLWDAFNNVQNHILNGGITYTLASKRQQTVRAITNVDLKIKINEELWEVTQKYVNQKQKVY